MLAKTKNSGGMLLTDHIDHTISAIEFIAKKFNFPESDVYRMGAILHDIGKCHPLQQYRFENNDFSDQRLFRHEVSSILFLSAFPKKYWDILIEMVISHHKSLRGDKSHRGLLDMIADSGIDRVFEVHNSGWETWNNHAHEILKEFGIPVVVSLDDAYENLKYVISYCEGLENGWSEYRGLLMAADHVASALEGNEYKNWFTIPDLSIYKNAKETDVYPLSKIKSDSTKPHTIVIAPTGAGKTNFLLKRCNSRIFYTLPYQASGNAMSVRLLNELRSQKLDMRVLHSASALVVKDDTDESKQIIAMQNKVGASIKVMTPHQLLHIVFAKSGYEAMLNDLRGQDVILDEVHTYSCLFFTYIIKLIKILKNYDVRFHIGTATAPTRLIDKFLEVLGEENVQFVRLTDEELTTFDRHQIVGVYSHAKAREKVEMQLKRGRKILYVCNTVKSAQAQYRKLKSMLNEKFPNVEIILIHSKFKRKRRRELEKEVFRLNDSKKPSIVVSTQVIEVSLDISFDCMITEPCPIDAFIQRIGRVFRKRELNRIIRYWNDFLVKFGIKDRYATIYLITQITREDKYVYEPKYQLRDKTLVGKNTTLIQDSVNVLMEIRYGILHETEIQRLIDVVYSKIDKFIYDDSDFSGFLTDANGEFAYKKLTHSTASLPEMLEINNINVIHEPDVPKYLAIKHNPELSSEIKTEKCLELEIPIFFPGQDNRIKEESWGYILRREFYDDTMGVI